MEGHRYATEHRRQDTDDLEARVRWEADEERETPVSPLLCTKSTACGIQVQVNYSEAEDHVMVDLRCFHAAREEIQTLKVRTMEARAGDDDFSAPMGHALSEVKQAYRERYWYQRTVRELQREFETHRQHGSGNMLS